MTANLDDCVALRECPGAETGEFRLNGPFSPSSSRQAQAALNQAAILPPSDGEPRMFAHIRSMSLAAALAAVSLFTMSDTASAALQCGKHDDIAKVLSSKFKETRRVMGVVNAKAVMELFMSTQGTWTMLVTDTAGTSCITASGEEWQEVPVTLAGLES